MNAVQTEKQPKKIRNHGDDSISSRSEFKYDDAGHVIKDEYIECEDISIQPVLTSYRMRQK